MPGRSYESPTAVHVAPSPVPTAVIAFHTIAPFGSPYLLPSMPLPTSISIPPCPYPCTLGQDYTLEAPLAAASGDVNLPQPGELTLQISSLLSSTPVRESTLENWKSSSTETSSVRKPTSTAHPQPKAEPKTNPKHKIRPYQIFLIVFFGLASIPISIAVVYLTGMLRRRRDFRHDEEWSSSWWKRHRGSRPGLLRWGMSGWWPGSKATGTAMVERGRAGGGDAGDSGRIVTEQHPHPHREPPVLLETEVGRAWGRARRDEDELDRVLVVPAPAASPLIRRSLLPPVVNATEQRETSIPQASKRSMSLQEAVSAPSRADGDADMETMIIGEAESRRARRLEQRISREAAVVTAQRSSASVASSSQAVKTQPQVSPAEQAGQSAERSFHDAVDKRRHSVAVALPARPLSTVGLLETLERSRGSIAAQGWGGMWNVDEVGATDADARAETAEEMDRKNPDQARSSPSSSSLERNSSPVTSRHRPGGALQRRDSRETTLPSDSQTHERKADGRLDRAWNRLMGRSGSMSVGQSSNRFGLSDRKGKRREMRLSRGNVKDEMEWEAEDKGYG